MGCLELRLLRPRFSPHQCSAPANPTRVGSTFVRDTRSGRPNRRTSGDTLAASPTNPRQSPNPVRVARPNDCDSVPRTGAAAPKSAGQITPGVIRQGRAGRAVVSAGLSETGWWTGPLSRAIRPPRPMARNAAFRRTSTARSMSLAGTQAGRRFRARGWAPVRRFPRATRVRRCGRGGPWRSHGRTGPRPARRWTAGAGPRCPGRPAHGRTHRSRSG